MFTYPISENAYDLIVAGGGPSGVMASLAAGRLGLKVLLIERHGFLGGMNTAGLVGPVMTFHAGSLQIVRGIPGEIMAEMKSLGASPGHLVDPIWANTTMTPIDTEVYKSLLMKKITDAGVTLLLHSMVVEGKLAGNGVESLMVANKNGLRSYRAKFFIDATGDGDLAASLGCEFQMGRPSDNLTQPMTLLFKMGGVDFAAVRNAIQEKPANFYLGLSLEQYLASPGLAVSGFYEEVKLAKVQRAFPFDRDRVLFFGLTRPGEVTVNSLRMSHVNGAVAEDLTKAEQGLRQQVPQMAEFLSRFIPGFKNAYVFETAAQVGVRETRHIAGDYCLTTENIFKQTRFEDSIAHASYPIDLHSPDGSGMKIIDPRAGNPDSYYDIPFRCLLPKKMENLLVTGRCISAEHEASASSRISATCMALGQAAGSAVFHVMNEKRSSFRELNIGNLQSQLIADGAYLSLLR